MQETRSLAQEEAEDIFFGQVVLIWARWFVILAATVLIFANSTTTGELSAGTLFIVVLMAVNFFLHGRYLMEQPANRQLIGVMSLVDLAVFTAIVLFFPGGGGIASPNFVFYYPALFAFALVFPPRFAIGYTALTLVVYTIACVIANPAFVTDGENLKDLIRRLITLAAMGGLGTFYWRIQRDRRRAAASVPAMTAARAT